MTRAVILVALSSASCVDDTSTLAPSGDAHTILTSATLFAHAINLSTTAPYDTVTLAVKTTMADGTTGGGQVRFTTSDSTIVVDSNGVLHAMFPTGNPSVVRVAVQLNGVTKHDSAQVSIITGAPSAVPRRATVAPLPDSSAKTIPGGVQTLVPSVRDANDSVIAGPLVALSSTAPQIARVDPFGSVTGMKTGVTMISVETYAFGRFLSDSIQFVVTEVPMYSYTFRVTNIGGDTTYSFGRDTARVNVGGIVIWDNSTGSDVDVVFDDPTNVDSASIGLFDPPPPATGRGNLAPFKLDSAGMAKLEPGTYEWAYLIYTSSWHARSFPVPGTYPFHSEKRPHVHGTIIVCDGPCER